MHTNKQHLFFTEADCRVSNRTVILIFAEISIIMASADWQIKEKNEVQLFHAMTSLPPHGGD